MKTLVEELQHFFKKHDIPTFGIAESKCLENEPDGYRPSDLLSSSSGLLSFGIPVPKGVFQDKKRVNKKYWRMASIYYHHIDKISSQVAIIIEAHNEIASPVFSCFPVELRGPGDIAGDISLVRIAEAAGLGKIGKNGLLFHSLYGPRLLLGGVITSAPLPTSTWPKKDNTECPEDCFICQDICPAGAIDKSGKINRPACIKHSMQSPLLSTLMKSKEYRAEEISSIFNTANVDGNAMYNCTKCVSECPKC